MKIKINLFKDVIEFNSTSYNVVGNLPKEMSDAAINQPEGEFPTVDINKFFVVYMTSLKVSKTDNINKIYNVEVLTYSPVIGGEPINMEEQGL